MANCGYYCVMYALYSEPNGEGEFLGYTDPVIIFYPITSPTSLIFEPHGDGSRQILVLGGPHATIGEAAGRCGDRTEITGCLPDEEDSESNSESEGASSSVSSSFSFSYSPSHSPSHSNSYSPSHSPSTSESTSGSGSEACGLSGGVVEIVDETNLVFRLINTGDVAVYITNMGMNNTTAFFIPDAVFSIAPGNSVDISMSTTLPYEGGELSVDNDCTDGALVLFV